MRLCTPDASPRSTVSTRPSSIVTFVGELQSRLPLTLRLTLSTASPAPAPLPKRTGHRPAVIFRGAERPDDPVLCFADAVALVQFDRTEFQGGGIQYQRMHNFTEDPQNPSGMGWIDIDSSLMESSASPLFDLQTPADVTAWSGLSHINIQHYQSADYLTPHFGRRSSAVVAVNCSAANCAIDGLTISHAGIPPHMPAVVLYNRGTVTGTTIVGGDSPLYGDGSAPA